MTHSAVSLLGHYFISFHNTNEVFIRQTNRAHRHRQQNVQEKFIDGAIGLTKGTREIVKMIENFHNTTENLINFCSGNSNMQAAALAVERTKLWKRFVNA